MAPERVTEKITDADILVIYGVGEHNAAELGASVASTLSANDVAVLDWTTKAWVPVSEFGSLSYSYLADLLSALGSAAARSVLQSGPSSGADEPWTIKITTYAVMCSSLAIIVWAIFAILWAIPSLLLPLMPPTAVPLALLYVRKAAIASTLFDLAASVALLIFGAVHGPTVNLYSIIRRLILMHLRPFLYCALVPMTINPLFAILPVYAVLSITHRYPELIGAPPEFPEENSFLVGLFLMIVCRYGPRLVVELVARLLGHARLGLKIMADVVMYLGDFHYRRCILSTFREREETEASKPVRVIVAHSLGSVIAVESLQTGDLTCPTILVTMGSPLSKWFHRFFPADYPSPDVICRDIKKRGPFIWVNVFRPDDPIGTSLSPAGETEIIDIDTQQTHLRNLDAHTDYFTDPHVRSLVLASVPQLLPSGSFAQGVPSQPLTLGATVGQRQVRGLKMASALLALAVFLTCMANTWVWFPGYRLEEIKRYLAAVDADGRVVDGTVVRDESNDVNYDNPPTYNDTVSYKIIFQTPGFAAGSKEWKGPFFWLNEHSASALGWVPPLIPVKSYYVPFHRINTASVQVRYMKSDPAHFYVPKIANLADDSGFLWRQITFSFATALLGLPTLWFSFYWLCGAYFHNRMPGFLDDAEKYGAHVKARKSS
jgi:hypothetical protein